MLQKPSKTSRLKEHCKKLEDRLATWKDGRADELIQNAALSKGNSLRMKDAIRRTRLKLLQSSFSKQ